MIKYLLTKAILLLYLCPLLVIILAISFLRRSSLHSTLGIITILLACICMSYDNAKQLQKIDLIFYDRAKKNLFLTHSSQKHFGIPGAFFYIAI